MKALAYGNVLDVVTDFMDECDDTNITMVLEFINFLRAGGFHICSGPIVDSDKQAYKAEPPF